jgi:hypothetical protein
LNGDASPARSRPGYIVFRQVGPDLWQLVGDVDRRPGLPARKSRGQAVVDVTGGAATADEVYVALPRSEWRVASDL